MLRPFHLLTCRVVLMCLGVLGFGLPGNVALAGESLGQGRTERMSVEVAHATPAKPSRVKRNATARATVSPRSVRLRGRRVSVARSGKRGVTIARRNLYHRWAVGPAKTATVVNKPVAGRRNASDATLSIGRALPASVAVVEAPTYQFAGYTAMSDGATARMWYSRTYTVKSPYAYVGRMSVDGQEVHVWMETTGTLLAGAVTESATEPLPAVAHLMERFPDGGQGVVIAGWDDFAPPVEPAVEVVEFTEPSR